MDEGCAYTTNAKILEDLAILLKGSTTKSTRKLSTSSLRNFSRDAFGGDLNVFGRSLSSSNTCLLSYPPEKLPQKIDFPNTTDDSNHQDARKDLVRGVENIGGDFVMSTIDNNEAFETVIKDTHFSKHSLMIIISEPRFMCRGINHHTKFST